MGAKPQNIENMNNLLSIFQGTIFTEKQVNWINPKTKPQLLKKAISELKLKIDDYIRTTKDDTCQSKTLLNTYKNQLTGLENDLGADVLTEEHCIYIGRLMNATALIILMITAMIAPITTPIFVATLLFVAIEETKRLIEDAQLNADMKETVGSNNCSTVPLSLC